MNANRIVVYLKYFVPSEKNGCETHGFHKENKKK